MAKDRCPTPAVPIKAENVREATSRARVLNPLIYLTPTSSLPFTKKEVYAHVPTLRECSSVTCGEVWGVGCRMSANSRPLSASPRTLFGGHVLKRRGGERRVMICHSVSTLVVGGERGGGGRSEGLMILLSRTGIGVIL
jgi:hypothetical protein